MAPLEPKPPDPCLHAPSVIHWSPNCSSQTEFCNTHSFRVIGTRFEFSKPSDDGIYEFYLIHYLRSTKIWYNFPSQMKLKVVFGSQNLGLYCTDRRLATLIARFASPNTRSVYWVKIFKPFFGQALRITIQPVEQHNGSHSSYVINLPFILCHETCKGHERKNIRAENSASISIKGLCFLFASEEHCSSKANYLTAFGPGKIMLIKSCMNPADVHIHPSQYTSLVVAFTIFIKQQAYDNHNRLRPTKRIFFLQGINNFSAHHSFCQII
ncbi:hypothetical protein Cgig2_017587 [Carnegiea gigantea]|uniref:Uncharacterized protein n=1 Tax=Carnegiea gigantea TaxID=171969 RepID=A0A9Q1QN14_9CARY|nr:hypothetical protein Cgig2_017587 [Carnegiea gigantea]